MFTKIKKGIIASFLAVASVFSAGVFTACGSSDNDVSLNELIEYATISQNFKIQEEAIEQLTLNDESIQQEEQEKPEEFVIATPEIIESDTTSNEIKEITLEDINLTNGQTLAQAVETFKTEAIKAKEDKIENDNAYIDGNAGTFNQIISQMTTINNPSSRIEKESMKMRNANIINSSFAITYTVVDDDKQIIVTDENELLPLLKSGSKILLSYSFESYNFVSYEIPLTNGTITNSNYVTVVVE